MNLRNSSGRCEHHGPGNGRTPVVAHQADVLEPQLFDDLEHMLDDLLELIVLDLHRPVGPAVAEGVRNDHAVAGLEQRRRLVLPAAAVIRHAVDQEGDLVAFALIADMVVITADFHCFSG